MATADFQDLDEDEQVDVGILRQALQAQSQQVAGMLDEQAARQTRALEEAVRRIRTTAAAGNGGGNGHDEQEGEEERFARVAKQLGVSPESLEKAAEAAKREQLKAQLRAIAEEDPDLVASMWDEGARLCLGDDYDETEDERGGKARKPNGRGKPSAGKNRPAKPEPDSEPEYVHWVDRPVSDWFK